MPDWPSIDARNAYLIGYMHPESIGIEGAALALPGPTSNAVNSDTVGIVVPLRLARPYTVSHVWWLNGGTVAGNIEVGVFDTTGVALIRSGNIAQATANVLQSAALGTPVTLPKGDYYLGLHATTITATLFSTQASITQLATHRALGVKEIGVTAAVNRFNTSETVSTAATWVRIPAFGIAKMAP